MSKPITHASLFSGIGGPEVAADMLGWKNLFHCEINPFGKAVLDYWYPDSESYEDITKTNFRQWRGLVSVLTGGFPCQPFSYAGKRKGREDNRYLWPEMLRVIDEIRPTWVVGENVAGISTMVEGGVCSQMGSEASIFGEGDDVHRYQLQQSFTIERICRDLERLGYSVQPVLVPAAAVGAPHRRDRIFILAHDADTNRSDDLRGAGEYEGAGRKERIQERDEVRQSGKPGDVRPALQGITEDTFCDGCRIGEHGEQGSKRNKRNIGAGDNERICGEKRILSSDTYSKRFQESQQPGRRKNLQEDRTRPDNRTLGLSGDARDASDTDLQRLNKPVSAQKSGTKERFNSKKDSRWRDGCLSAERRWATFPTVSPVHRGNDGLPFNVDNLTIPQTRWRTESLKAYGNAIVPQVMYEIFLMIDKIENEHLH